MNLQTRHADAALISTLARAPRTSTHRVRESGFEGIIYEPPSGNCTIVWHEPGKPGRQRAMRTGLDRARAFLKGKLKEIAQGDWWLRRFGEPQARIYERLEEIRQTLPREYQATLETLLQEAVAARLKNSGAKFLHQTCPEVVAALLAQKRAEKKCGEKWLRNLEAMLNRLAEYFPGPLHLIQPPDLNEWLRGLKGGLVFRHHHYAAAVQLCHYAKTSNAAPADAFGPDFWHLVDDPDRPPVKVCIWDLAQLQRLLRQTRPNMIPFTVCQAFAGIRTEELSPEDPRKVPLDWSDFDWERNEIHIGLETGKTGERIVPISDNLAAWLKPYRKERGQVCEIAEPTCAMYKAKLRAGLPSAKSESRNVLRKSCISYRLALVKNIGQVAEESGNSPAKIKSNYRRPRSESEAKAWFGLLPTTQMNLPGL
jgi:hypothetical protein